MPPSCIPRSRLLAPYYPSLDGLRALAILLVLTFHLGSLRWQFKLFSWGWVGVNLFFVLSGFLITGILYDSLHRRDYFRNFYTRRALRIFPLYYGVLLAVALVTLLPSIHAGWNRYFLTWPVYLGNLFIPAGRMGLHPAIEDIPFRIGSGPWLTVSCRHLWSLCVEEQFYLVWPAVVWLFRTRARLLVICGVVIVAEPIARMLYVHAHPWTLGTTDTTYLVTWFRADSLLIGAVVALWLRGTDPPLRSIRRAAAVLSLAPLLLLLVINHFWPGFHSYSPLARFQVVTFGMTFIDLASAGLLVLTLDSSSWVAKVLGLGPLVWLGRISYGVYVLHMFTLDVIPWLVDPWLAKVHLTVVEPILAMVISILLGWLSFRYFESWFLRLKPRLAPRPEAADDPPPFLQPQHNESARS